MANERPAPSLNKQAPWEQFDSGFYHDHNYQSLRDDDLQIIEVVRDFFGSAGVVGGLGIDVGAGTNLYPSMAMLPFCRQIDLWEFSGPNVHWLKRQVGGFDPSWDQFWSAYQKHPAYGAVHDPRDALRQLAKVTKGSVFDLPEAHWDIGTMFFVACSISTEMWEFTLAVQSFARSLKRHAPFAAAFMKNSNGYAVGDIMYPAVRISEQDVTHSFDTVAYDVNVREVESKDPLRPGYESMIVAVGRAAG